jgi:hypothetical protein
VSRAALLALGSSAALTGVAAITACSSSDDPHTGGTSTGQDHADAAPPPPRVACGDAGTCDPASDYCLHETDCVDPQTNATAETWKCVEARTDPAGEQCLPVELWNCGCLQGHFQVKGYGGATCVTDDAGGKTIEATTICWTGCYGAPPARLDRRDSSRKRRGAVSSALGIA